MCLGCAARSQPLLIAHQRQSPTAWSSSRPIILEKDPGQENPIQDADVEARMIEHMVRLMEENNAPPEQFERLGLPHRRV